jgi:hypothetical protein
MIKNLAKALVFSLIFSTALKASAQDLQTIFLYTKNGASQQFTIPEGKIAEIVYAFGYFNFFRSASNDMKPFDCVAGSSFPSYLCGPGVIEGSGSAGGMMTLRLKDNISSTTTIPTSAVVIPTDATGPVNVILESSTDLVTWTAANPGTYGSSTTKRFFRVRAVNQ